MFTTTNYHISHQLKIGISNLAHLLEMFLRLNFCKGIPIFYLRKVVPCCISKGEPPKSIFCISNNRAWVSNPTPTFKGRGRSLLQAFHYKNDSNLFFIFHFIFCLEKFSSLFLKKTMKCVNLCIQICSLFYFFRILGGKPLKLSLYEKRRHSSNSTAPANFDFFFCHFY